MKRDGNIDDFSETGGSTAETNSVPLEPHQQELLEILMKLDGDKTNKYSLADMYRGVLAVLESNNTNRFPFAALGIREIFRKLPQQYGVGWKAHGEGLTGKARNLEDSWNAIEDTWFRDANGWTGKITDKLSRFLAESEEFFLWFKEHIPRRADETAALLYEFDPSRGRVPEELERLNVEAFKRMLDFFSSITHFGKKISEEEFDKWLRNAEFFLKDRLKPPVTKNFREIDSIIKAGEEND